jgi:hypothetical protein
LIIVYDFGVLGQDEYSVNTETWLIAWPIIRQASSWHREVGTIQFVFGIQRKGRYFGFSMGTLRLLIV